MRAAVLHRAEQQADLELGPDADMGAAFGVDVDRAQRDVTAVGHVDEANLHATNLRCGNV